MNLHQNLKQPLFILGFLVIIIFLFGFSSSHPTTNSMGRTGAPGDGVCNDCHSPSSSTIDGSVMITGVPSNIQSGITYPITITSNHSNGSPMAAGFQVVALLDDDNSNAGSWSNAGASSSIKMAGGKTYFGHQPRVFFGGNTSISWTADWQAPTGSAGDDITFYAVTNLVNGNGSTSGDKPEYNTLTVSYDVSGDPLECEALFVSNVTCFGESDGEAVVGAWGGDGDFTYVWDNGETGPIATMLDAGVHTVTVTDGVGEQSTCEAIITEPNLLIADVNATDALCFDSNLGTAYAEVTGGTESYSYDWSNNQTGSFQNNLVPGDYSYTVTDANGCTAVSNFTIFGPTSPLVISLIEYSNASCSGQNDGLASVLATGGSPGYIYYWPDIDLFGDVQNNLAEGTYVVEATDINNCLSILPITIGIDNVLEFTVDSIANNVCSDDSTGVAVVSTNGGLTPYTYNWSDGGTGANRTDLAVGSYNITSTDANGCTVIGMLSILHEDNEPPTTSSDSIVLYVNEDGNVMELSAETILALVVDNCGVNVVEWILPNFNCDNLGANDLEIIMLDINANVDTAVITIIIIDTIPPVITCPEHISSNSCGAITYDMPIATDNCEVVAMTLVTGLPSGSSFPVGVTTITYSAIDTSGNITSCSFEVMVDIDFEINVMVSQVTCEEGSDGSASFSISGGIAPYTIVVDTFPEVILSNGTDTTFNDLIVGTHSFVISDASGCIIQDSFVVTAIEGMNITAEISDVSCFNFNDGYVEFSISGGTAPYSIEFQNDIDYTMLEAGNYAYTITDENGCSKDSSVTISQPMILFISGHTITNASSAEANDGSIIIDIFGGVAPYTFEWVMDNVIVSDSMNLENASPGTYVCTVIDANGCQYTSLEWMIDFESGVLDDYTNSWMNVYPNPTTGIVYAEMPNILDNNLQVSIVDLLGKSIYTAPVSLLNGKFSIDLSIVNNGIYFFRVKGKNIDQYKKIIILD